MLVRGLQQVLAIVNVGQLRACLPVINGTSVGSSGVEIVQAAIGVVLHFIRVCHLILSLFPNAL